MEAVTCHTCGVTFGLEPNFLVHLVRTGREFHCPNGHVIKIAKDDEGEKGLLGKIAELEARNKRTMESEAFWKARAAAMPAGKKA